MTAPADRPALALLAEIQYYVPPKPFSLDGITRGLGKNDSDALARQIAWLTDGGYIEQLGGGSMRLTQKGGSYRPPAAAEDDDGFRIEFAESRKPEAEGNDAVPQP